MPGPHNIVEFETNHGYKAVELHHGDITDLSVPVDVVVISAYKNNYRPTPGTMIKALKQRGIEVGRLAEEPLVDLRPSLGCWLSQPLKGRSFHYLCCVEIRELHSRAEPFPEFSGIFSLLAATQFMVQPAKVAAMPLVGTGQQGIPPTMVLDRLIPLCRRALEQITSLEKILFVEIDADKVVEIDSAMNQTLGRDLGDLVTMPGGDATVLLETALGRLLRRLAAHDELAGAHRIILDLTNRMKRRDLRLFEFGILARRLVEACVHDILDQPKRNLSRSIEALREQGVADWILGYLHLLRMIGNEAAHSTNHQDRFPREVARDDLPAALACLERVLVFWLDWRESRTP